MSLSLHQMTVLSSVLIRVSIAVIKKAPRPQTALGGKSLFQLTTNFSSHMPLLAEVRAGTWRLELTKRLASDDAYWLATHG